MNTPVGLNFLIAGYAYTRGGIATDPALPIEDADLTLHTGLLAYAAAGAFVFTKNDDFLGQTREQAPLYSLQTNVVYDFSPRLWGALTATTPEAPAIVACHL